MTAWYSSITDQWIHHMRAEPQQN